MLMECECVAQESRLGTVGMAVSAPQGQGPQLETFDPGSWNPKAHPGARAGMTHNSAHWSIHAWPISMLWVFSQHGGLRGVGLPRGLGLQVPVSLWPTLRSHTIWLCATYWLKQSQDHLDFKEGNKEFWSHVFKLPQLLLFSELYKGPLAQKVLSMLSSLPICLVVSVEHDSCWLRVRDVCEQMCLWMGTQGDKPVTTSMLSLYVCFCLRVRMSGGVPSLSPFQNS